MGKPAKVLIHNPDQLSIGQNTRDMITRRKKLKELNVKHMKYIDDLTLAESIDMATQLDTVPVDERPLPDSFRDRTGHQLKPGQSKLYDKLKDIQNYAEVNKMKLNVPKTKLILFNPCKSKNNRI